MNKAHYIILAVVDVFKSTHIIYYVADVPALSTTTTQLTSDDSDVHAKGKAILCFLLCIYLRIVTYRPDT